MKPDTGLTIRRRRASAAVPILIACAGLAVAGYLVARELTRATTCPPPPVRAVFGPPVPTPEPVACPVADAPSVGFVGRFVDRLHTTATPDEVRDVLNRVWAESRWQPDAVSKRGAVGLCGIRLSAWPDVDSARLTTDPAYQADQCLRIYRLYVAQCGDAWQCCYLRGRAGCARSKEG